MKSTTTASAHTVTALPDTCLMIVRRPGAATTGWDAEGAPPGKSWREGKTASHSRARAGLQLLPSGSYLAVPLTSGGGLLSGVKLNIGLEGSACSRKAAALPRGLERPGEANSGRSHTKWSRRVAPEAASPTTTCALGESRMRPSVVLSALRSREASEVDYLRPDPIMTPMSITRGSSGAG